MSEFAALFGLIFAILALHPITLYPLSLLVIARRMGGKASATESETDSFPAPRSLAICMSAYNEETVIAAKMERLIEIARAYGRATVHVYVDAPTDNTAAILSRYTDRADIVFGKERMGKTFGMNLLVNRSASELILFTDANVESGIDVARELARPLADPTIGCTTARLVYSNRKETATANLGALYWSMEEAIKRLESRSMGLVGCDGAMFMMRRSLHIAPPPYLIDDLFLSLSILIAGSRIVSVEHVEVFERSATRPAEEGHRKRRIACQAWNVHRALWPRLRRMPAISIYAYFSHRPMKWLMPFFVLGSVISFDIALALAAGPIFALGALGVLGLAYILGAVTSLPPFSMFHSAVRSLAGIGLGTIESFALRKTYTTWNPAISVRDQIDGPATR